MASRQGSSKQNWDTDRKRDNGNSFGAAMAANNKLSYGSKSLRSRSRSMASDSTQKERDKSRRSSPHKHNASPQSPGNKEKQQSSNNRNQSNLGLSGIPSMAELDTEIDARYRSIRESPVADVQLPNLEEALKPLMGSQKSKEGFAYLINLCNEFISRTTSYLSTLPHPIEPLEELVSVISVTASLLSTLQSSIDEYPRYSIFHHLSFLNPLGNDIIYALSELDTRIEDAKPSKICLPNVAGLDRIPRNVRVLIIGGEAKAVNLRSRLYVEEQRGWQNQGGISIPDVQRRDFDTSRACRGLTRIEPLTWFRESLSWASSWESGQELFDSEATTNNEVYETTHQIIGRQHLANWKTGAGRAKDWRQHTCAKLATKRQCLISTKTERKSGNVSEKVKVKSTSFHGLSGRGIPSAALKSQEKVLTKNIKPEVVFICISNLLGHMSISSGGKYLQMVEEDNLVMRRGALSEVKHSQIGREHLHIPLDLLRLYHFQAGKRKSHSKDQDSPFAMYHVGEILPLQHVLLRLKEHIRSENHYELYGLEDVNSGQNYETRVYDLHGLSKTERARRVKSLKRDTASPSKHHNFHINGKHYLVFALAQHKVSVSTPKLGPIGRRNSPGYNAAFPLLRGCKPVVLPRPVKKPRTWAARFSPPDITVDACEFQKGAQTSEPVSQTNKIPQKTDSPPIERPIVPDVVPVEIPNDLDNAEQSATEILEALGKTRGKPQRSSLIDYEFLTLLGKYSAMCPLNDCDFLYSLLLCSIKGLSFDKATLRIIAEELLGGNTKSAAECDTFSRPLPLASRLMIRLNRLS